MDNYTEIGNGKLYNYFDSNMNLIFELRDKNEYLLDKAQINNKNIKQLLVDNTITIEI